MLAMVSPADQRYCSKTPGRRYRIWPDKLSALKDATKENTEN